MPLQLQKIASSHLLTGHSPELTARVRDELDELAVTMCTSKLQQSGHTPEQAYDQVTEAVKDELNASTLDPGDSPMVVMKVQDTIE